MDYEKMWNEIKTILVKITEDKNKRNDFFEMLAFGYSQQICQSLLNKMNLMQNGFFICPKCGKREEKECSLWCQGCMKQNQEWIESLLKGDENENTKTEN